MSLYGNDDLGENRSGAGGLGLAVLMLGLLGAAVALLSTKQGQQLRDDLAGRADDWKAQAAQTLSQTRERVVDSIDSGGNRVEPEHAPPGQKVRDKA